LIDVPATAPNWRHETVRLRDRLQAVVDWAADHGLDDPCLVEAREALNNKVIMQALVTPEPARDVPQPPPVAHPYGWTNRNK
jgi:hypothetical protein